jgi:hypothetical protein
MAADSEDDTGMKVIDSESPDHMLIFLKYLIRNADILPFESYGKHNSQVICERPFTNPNICNFVDITQDEESELNPLYGPAYPFPVFPPPLSILENMKGHPHLASMKIDRWTTFCGRLMHWIKDPDPDYDPYVSKKKKGKGWKSFSYEEEMMKYFEEYGATGYVYSVWEISPSRVVEGQYIVSLKTEYTKKKNGIWSPKKISVSEDVMPYVVSYTPEGVYIRSEQTSDL